jgi:hypothetical protein
MSGRVLRAKPASGTKVELKPAPKGLANRSDQGTGNSLSVALSRRLFEEAEKRLPRCGGNHRGRAAADHKVRGDEDRGSTRPASIAPGAGATGQPAHRHYQSDPRLPAGARYRGPARATLLAGRIAAHFGHATRCPVAAHGAGDRGPGGRLSTWWLTLSSAGRAQQGWKLSFIDGQRTFSKCPP